MPHMSWYLAAEAWNTFYSPGDDTGTECQSTEKGLAFVSRAADGFRVLNTRGERVSCFFRQQKRLTQGR